MRADLHIHSCLSPCGDLRMSPREIAYHAAVAGLQMIAVVDHNAGLNAPASARAAAARGLAVLTGVEVTTVEELHVLALFDDPLATVEFGRQATARLASVPVSRLTEVDQPVVNEEGEIETLVPVWLGAATDWPLTELCEAICAAGGLCVPSHVDRPAMSVLSQLGRMPELPFDAVEVSDRYDCARDPAGLRGRWAMIRTSDAHHPEEIGRGWTELPLATGRVEDCRAAFAELRARQLADPTAGLPPRVGL
ncbi:MAG: PHP domain-containing protein [Kiritimatiellae bacterium]|nr:PHP domain-containing protein [Kiritimatiellia bacterium]